LHRLHPTPSLPEGGGAAPDTEGIHRASQYASRLQKELEPSLTGGLYMNFVDGREAYDRTKDGYTPESFRRLQRLKSRMDPDNLFRFGFPIAPRG